MQLITQPGVYEIPIERYHGEEICDSPSISSSGLKVIAKCPIKYWTHSNLNPSRQERKDSDALKLGRAAHDLILDGVGWPDRYHIAPQGYNGTKKEWFSARDELREAESLGKTVLKWDDYVNVKGMADAISKHPIHKALGRGKAEQTIVWKDAETGVWLRIRPDFLPDSQQFIPDFKTTASADPDDFAKSVANFGYHQQAALYLDGLAAVFGERDRQFYFIAQEKDAPYIVQPFAIDAESVAWGRRLNRKAIRTFARCLETDTWPGYADDFVTVGLPRWKAEQLEKTFTEF